MMKQNIKNTLQLFGRRKFVNPIVRQNGITSSVAGFSSQTNALTPVDIPKVSLTKYTTENFVDYGNKIALVDGLSGDKKSFKDLLEQIDYAAQGLINQGFTKDSTLLIHLPNCVDYFVAFHAAAKLGGVVSTANGLYTPKELAHQLTDSGTTHVLTANVLQEAMKGGLEQVKNKDIHVNVLGSNDCFLSNTQELSKQPVQPDHESLLVLPYSSGTTGLPKGVCLSHRNMIANIAQITQNPDVNVGITSTDVVLGVLPFFHIYGMTVVLHAALKQGATVVTMPKFDPEAYYQIIEKYKVSFAPLVPPIVLLMSHDPFKGKYDISSLKTIFCGAAPLDGALQKKTANMISVSIRQGYGMTEMAPVSHLVPESSADVTGSVGVAVPNTESKIVDENGNLVPVGEVGELWCRGPQVMMGYLNNEKATKETITSDGWIKTGDMAKMDSNGFYFVVDRLKELIKVKGFQVAPAELEGILVTNDTIMDACVVPEPDEKAGEIPHAFIVLRQDIEPTISMKDEIMNETNSHLSSYKHIKRITFVESIPKSASGKLLRRMLKEQL